MRVISNVKRVLTLSFAVMALALIPSTVALAADTEVTQEITGGTLTTAILDASRVTVPSPSFAFPATSFSFDCQTVNSTLGSNTQRLYVINPSATTAGESWTLTLAGTGSWTSGGNSYAYNDAAGTGCTNGQLTVNPAAGTLTDDCVSTGCTAAVITQGTSTAMSGATPVTLLSAPVGTQVYRGYLTNIGLSQKIPGEKPAGNYVLEMTITATAS